MCTFARDHRHITLILQRHCCFSGTLQLSGKNLAVKDGLDFSHLDPKIQWRINKVTVGGKSYQCCLVRFVVHVMGWNKDPSVYWANQDTSPLYLCLFKIKWQQFGNKESEPTLLLICFWVDLNFGGSHLLLQVKRMGNMEKHGNCEI